MIDKEKHLLRALDEKKILLKNKLKTYNVLYIINVILWIFTFVLYTIEKMDAMKYAAIIFSISFIVLTFVKHKYNKELANTIHKEYETLLEQEKKEEKNSKKN